MTETISNAVDEGNPVRERLRLHDQINALITRIHNLDQPEEAAELEAIHRENDYEVDDETRAGWRSGTDHNMRRVLRNVVKLDEVFDEERQLHNDLKQWLSDWFRREHERFVADHEHRFVSQCLRDRLAAKKAGLNAPDIASEISKKYVAPPYEEWGSANVSRAAEALMPLLIEMYSQESGEKTPVLTRGLDRLTRKAILVNMYVRAGEFCQAKMSV